MPLDPAQDSIDRGLIYDAFTKAIARRRPLRPVLRGRGHAVVVQPPTDRQADHVVQRHEEQLDGLQQAYGSALVGVVPEINQPFSEAIRVRLEQWDSRWWFVYEPYTWIDLPRIEDVESSSNDLARSPSSTDPGTSPKIVAADWRRERWAQRYNPTWNRIVAAWAKFVAPESETELLTHYFDSEGINGIFRISWTTAWSSPAQALARSRE